MNGKAQEYIWPTDASQSLTSTFAEYRSGHFHAGIDIKTWGQTGYKIFAVRPGYVMRIRVSSYGYGRALYLKCDTGDIVIYGHLKGYNPEIERLVKEEQQRAGQFSVDLYLKEGEIPVTQGEILGYTGDTGVGPPHLHFEMRDPYNLPMNAMIRGYKVADTIAPRLSAVSLTPLDGYSRVEDDVEPIILAAQFQAANQYQVARPISISGRVAFGITCHDEMNDGGNRFSPYQLRLIVDDQELFATQYDRFSYDLTSQIYLDRDFRLMVRGKGKFHQLFRDLGNKLDFYSRPEVYAGVLTTDKNDQTSASITKNAHYLAPGLHHWRIEVMDFNRNQSSIAGTLQVIEKPEIAFAIRANERGEKIAVITSQNHLPLANIRIYGSQTGGNSWFLVREWKNSSENLTGIASDAPLHIPLSNGGNGSALSIFKALAKTDLGIESQPIFFAETTRPPADTRELKLSLDKSYYDDFIRLELRSSEMLTTAPDLTLLISGRPSIKIPIQQQEQQRYHGLLFLDENMPSPIIIETAASGVSGQSAVQRDSLYFYPTSTKRPGFLNSKDQMCRVVFQPRSVYKFFIARVDEAPIRARSGFETVGKAYQIEPDDVPLRDGARILLRYPATESQPEKLAIYWWNRLKASWNFLDNKIDYSERMIAGTVSSLGIYTLVRDLEPPNIFSQYPSDNSIIGARRPRLMAHLRDSLSGIRNENYMAMYLDGKKVIAEYDPDSITLFYTPDEPLTPGEHTFIVWAQDRCGNEAKRTTRFVVQ